MATWTDFSFAAGSEDGKIEAMNQKVRHLEQELAQIGAEGKKWSRWWRRLSSPPLMGTTKLQLFVGNCWWEKLEDKQKSQGKLKSFCTAKETINTMLRPPHELKKIFVNNTSNKRLIAKIHRRTHPTLCTNNTIKKSADDPTRYFSKRRQTNGQ